MRHPRIKEINLIIADMVLEGLEHEDDDNRRRDLMRVAESVAMGYNWQHLEAMPELQRWPETYDLLWRNIVVGCPGE